MTQAALLGMFVFAAAASAQTPCPVVEPLRTGYGLDAPAEFAAEFDGDGPGPSLRAMYLSGTFTTAAGETADGLARWDGAALAPVPGCPAGPKGAMAAFDDGDGEGLYIAGATGILHRYRADAWDQLALPTFHALEGAAESFAVFDPDDAGPRPVGLFTLVHYAGLAGENNAVLWRLDAQGWYRLSGAVPRGKIIGFDTDGPGPGPTDLYHYFNVQRAAPDRTVGYVRRLRQDHWELAGYTGGNTQDTGLADAAVFDPDGAGPTRPVLAVVGGFGAIRTGAGAWRYTGAAAMWNGAGWGTVGFSVPTWFHAISVGVSTSGQLPVLVVGSEPNGAPNSTTLWETHQPWWSWHIYRWAVAVGPRSVTLIREFYPEGAGQEGAQLLVSGELHHIAGVQVERFAALNHGYDGPPVLGGVPTPLGITTLQVFDDGSGRRLFAGGTAPYSSSGAPGLSGVSRWDGQQWEPLGAPFYGTVYTLAPHDDGTGWALYAGGVINGEIGQQTLRGLARWDGSEWEAVGAGDMQGGVYALARFDPDGPGPQPMRLYAGGDFVRADGVLTGGLARWDGPQDGWRAVPGFMGGTVYGLKVLDHGGGPALYICGHNLNIVGHPVNSVFRLRPGGWESLPTLIGGGQGVYATPVADVALDFTGPQVRLAAIQRSGTTRITTSRCAGCSGWRARGGATWALSARTPCAASRTSSGPRSTWATAA